MNSDGTNTKATGEIRAVELPDAAGIASIYNFHITNTIATFHETVIGDIDMAKRIAAVTVAHPWFVCEHGGSVVGYAYASTWQRRAAYRNTVETAVYVQEELLGRGIGSRLYEKLIAELRDRQFHCAVAGISLPNPASIALHQRHGFEQVAEFKEVGRKLGRWIDVAYWQLML